jgi:DNA-binding MarR family transcriptional regulator
MGERKDSKGSVQVSAGPELENAIRKLAHFRYALRKFHRFSENAARSHGVTPQQHQLMLGVAGFTGRGSATISELAEFLQERNHSVVELAERAAGKGLVIRAQDAADRRVVNVTLTRKGKDVLSELTKLHQGEAIRVQGLWETCVFPTLPKGRTKKTG